MPNKSETKIEQHLNIFIAHNNQRLQWRSVEIYQDIISSAAVKYSKERALKLLISSCRGQHMIFNPEDD